ncbi:MAG: hypothetical protein Q8J89_05625 [Caulobacter sp.]|nr:hypothetical protein [Caulobacter sp.]
MILQALLIAMLLLQPAAATPPPAEAPATETPATAVPAQPAPMTTEQAIAGIDALMAPWKGKSGERLRGRLGLTETTRIASDGQVGFWLRRSEATACGISDSGVIRCGVIGGSVCRLAIAFDKTGKVTNWKATGTGDACEPFLDEIGSPE